MSKQSATLQRAGRYAVRITGPSGWSRYITRQGDESDNTGLAQTFERPLMAYRLIDGLMTLPGSGNVVYEVVNLDDPEECPEDE
jgi:hypothetical protein